jgi:hypothetical protein
MNVHRTALFVALLAAVVCVPASAQGGNEIFLAPLQTWGSSVRIGTPINITRRPGYDNQPAFTRDGRAVLFTSQREGQTDIYRYDIATDSSTPLTSTFESEYSATPAPDGGGFSVIRVERDSTQRLWRFADDGTQPRIVLEHIKPVGYHAWANDRELVLFVLGSPATLQRASTTTGRADTVVRNPGRSIHRIPGKNAVSFVHKVSDKEWWIKQLDFPSGTITSLVRALEGSEDYAWTPKGMIVMASGNTVYSWNSLTKDGWREVARFQQPGLQAIRRIAVSPKGDRIAMVGDEPNQ